MTDTKRAHERDFLVSPSGAGRSRRGKTWTPPVLAVLLGLLPGCEKASRREGTPREPGQGGRLTLIPLPEEALMRRSRRPMWGLGFRLVSFSTSQPAGLNSRPEHGGEVFYAEISPFGRRKEGSRLTLALGRPAPEAEKGADEAGKRSWRLFLDTDLDGDLAEQRALLAAPESPEGAGPDITSLWFPPVEFVRPGGGRYWGRISVLVAGPRGKEISGSPASELKVTGRFMPACALSGEVRLFGEEREVLLLDANANGIFGEEPGGPNDIRDTVWVDLDGNGTRSEEEYLPLSRRLFWRGKAARVGLSPDETRIEVEEFEPELASVRRKGDTGTEAEPGRIVLFYDDYGLVNAEPGGEVPAGKARLVGYELVREDESAGETGREWRIFGQWLPPSAPELELEPGRAGAAEFGPPLAARAWVRFEGSRQALFLVSLRGSGGEHVVTKGPGGPLSSGSFRVLSRGREGEEKEIGSGKLEPAMPGVLGARWKVPAETPEGKELVLEAELDLGPFAVGLSGRAEFEVGRSTPVRLVVSGVERGTQAEEVGLKVGDVVLKYDGKPVESPLDLFRAMRDVASAGKERVELVVLRRGIQVPFTLKPGRIGVQTLLSLP